MRSEAFWHYFEATRPRLKLRGATFAAMFEYLDRFDRPVGIIETGCVRRLEAELGGDGGSTILFDKYAAFHPGSTVHTVDIDAAATQLCRQVVSDRVAITWRHSVAFLNAFAASPPRDFTSLDLLYLDSSDFNAGTLGASTVHHLGELTAAQPLLHEDTMVVVDESPAAILGVHQPDGGFVVIGTPDTGGKGRLVAEYAKQVGATLSLRGFHAGWTAMRRGVRDNRAAVRAVIAQSPQGLFATAPQDAFVGKSLRESGQYGQDQIDLAAGFVSSADSVLVVGAHVGSIAIPLARRCQHLTAIEANPWTHKLLQCNLVLNDASNVVAHHFAASDRAGTIRFVMNTHNSGGSKRYPLTPDPAYFYDNPDIVEVPCFALDEKLDRHDYALVFMDIEGSEYFALRGMPKILQSARCLIVEFLPHHLTNVAGITPETFAEALVPHFASMFVPSLGRRFARPDFAPALREMFDRGQGDEGLVFTK